jgi:hypothetical protein
MIRDEQYYSYDEQKEALGFVLPGTSARLVFSAGK